MIQLPETKSSARAGAVESVTLADGYRAPALFRHLAHRLPGYQLLQMPPAQFRSCFHRLLSKLQVTDLGLTPYSLTRSGTAYAFQRIGKLDVVALQGRWRDLRTAGIYFNSGLLELVKIAYPPTTTQGMFALQDGLLSTFGQT